MDIERKREQNRIRQRAYRERKRQAAAAQAAVNVQSAIEQQNVNADIAEEKSNIVAILNRITNLAEARAIDENRRIINRNRQRMYRERKRQAAAAQAAQVEAASEQAVIINILDAIIARAAERDVSWNTVTEVADGKIIRLRDSELVVPENHPDAKNAAALIDLFSGITVERIIDDISRIGSIKIQFGMTFIVEKDGKQETVVRFTKMKTLYINATREEIERFVLYSGYRMIEQAEIYLVNGSDWTIVRIAKFHLKSDRFRPGRAGAYVKTPRWIISKKCCINVQNTDEQCFRYALTAAVERPAKHSDRPGWYDKPERVKFNLDGIEYPAPFTNATFKRFERQNPAYVLSVFIVDAGDKSDDLQVLYCNPDEAGKKRITLLVLYDDKNYHYTTITSFNALMCNSHDSHTCHRCLHTYNGAGSKDRLARHIIDCNGLLRGDVQKIEMPAIGSVQKYVDTGKSIRCRYAYYCDFESSIVKIDESRGLSTQLINVHVANSYNWRLVDHEGALLKEMHYRGDDAARHCIETLLESSRGLSYEHAERQKMTYDQMLAHKSADKCHLCGDGDFTDYIKKDSDTKLMSDKEKREYYKQLPTVKVKNYCPNTGKYLGAAHKSCVISRDVRRAPVFIHNLKGYDSHLLLKDITPYVSDKCRLSVIATNTEKCLSFSLDELVFKDSCQFLTASLDKLVEGLVVENLKHTKMLADDLKVDLELLCKKGVYPYSWVDSHDKFQCTSLPPIEAFYNDIADEACSVERYAHARNVWDAAECKNFGDYHDIYLRLDVCLLADVFENFRNVMYRNFQLDPAHYYTLPGFSWDAAFKHTRAELDLLNDVDMHIAFENALRGGVCVVSHRKYEANNPTVAGYDSSKPTTWLRYDDANNLYGWAMTQCLPTSNFLWGDPLLWNEARIAAIKPDDLTGAMFEVDLEYPNHLHDAHNDYPLCPEKMKAPMLSPYAQSVCGSYVPCEKLIPNLMDKTKYWIQGRNLQFVLEQGLLLKKIHRVIEFSQSAWLKPYIEYNTAQRTKATTDAEKDMYKLLNNAVFGKTMENLRARRDIDIIGVNTKKWVKWVNNPSYVQRKNISDTLVVGERTKTRMTLNKPVYCGAVILDLSKLLMQKFWYENLRPKYPSAKLLYTDTDSLVYSITNDSMPDFHGRAGGDFDTSGYPKNHPLYSADNKKVVGKFKDEMNGVSIAKFIGLRSKQYTILNDEASYKLINDPTVKLVVKKSKGTKSSVVKKIIKYQDYDTTLSTGVAMKHKQISFQTNCHRICTSTSNKTSLGSFDDKRYLLSDGISSYAYGHYRINN